MIDSKNIQANTSKRLHSVQKHSQTLIAQISSPLPPPEMLIGYERAQPGLINKIIEMTEAESNHRRALEKQKLLAEVNSLQRGDTLISRAQIFASGIVGIIGAFIKNSKREK